MDITKTPLGDNIVLFTMIAENPKDVDFITNMLKMGIPVTAHAGDMIQFKIDTTGSMIPRTDHPLDEL